MRNTHIIFKFHEFIPAFPRRPVWRDMFHPYQFWLEIIRVGLILPTGSSFMWRCFFGSLLVSLPVSLPFGNLGVPSLAQRTACEGQSDSWLDAVLKILCVPYATHANSDHWETSSLASLWDSVWAFWCRSCLVLLARSRIFCSGDQQHITITRKTHQRSLHIRGVRSGSCTGLCARPGSALNRVAVEHAVRDRSVGSIDSF